MGSVVPFRQPLHAQSLVKHTATLNWLDRHGEAHRERHAAWTAAEATRMAWKRIRSMRLSGEALTFRIDHRSQVVS
jgi:hypothetical protein